MLILRKVFGGQLEKAPGLDLLLCLALQERPQLLNEEVGAETIVNALGALLHDEFRLLKQRERRQHKLARRRHGRLAQKHAFSLSATAATV